MKKKLIIIIPLLIAGIAFLFVYRYYNKEDKTTTLTVQEKRWVEENKNNSYDFEVVNDYPLYGINGEGVIFKFLSDLEENIKIKFNKIPYLKDSKPTSKGYRIQSAFLEAGTPRGLLTLLIEYDEDDAQRFQPN